MPMMKRMTPKDDVHGIGYSGLKPEQALRGNIERSTAVQVHTKSGAKISFKGQVSIVGCRLFVCLTEKVFSLPQL